MAKIFIYIFSFLTITSVLSDSISKKELSALKQSSVKKYQEKNYAEAIPLLEKYLSFRDEIQFKIYLAKSLILRKDLEEPKEEDDAFLKKEKANLIQRNYNHSAFLFSESVTYLEEITPKDKKLGELYFLWAYAEYFGVNKEKAIGLFKKSAKLNPTLKTMANYNIGSIYEELGQKKDSSIYFNKP